MCKCARARVGISAGRRSRGGGIGIGEVGIGEVGIGWESCGLGLGGSSGKGVVEIG